MHYSATLINQVPLATWHRFFAEIGYPTGCSEEQLSLSDVVAEFAAARRSDVLDAGEALERLGSEAGRDELFELEPGLATEARLKLGAAELVIDLWLDGRKNAVVARALRRARTVMEHRTSTRTTRMFRSSTRTARSVAPDQVRAALESELNRALPDLGYAERVFVEHYQESATVSTFIVSRGSRPKDRRVFELGTAKHTRQTEEEVESVKLRHGQMVKIVSGRGLVGAYQQAIGTAVSGDANAFSEPLIYALDGLLNGTVRLQSHGIADLVAVKLVEFEVERGPTRIRVRTPDGEAEVANHRQQYTGTRVVRAHLKLSFAGGKKREVRVSLGSPNSLALSNSEFEHVVEDFLDAVGLVGPASEVRGLTSWWDLYEHRISEGQGLELFKSEWDELKRAKVFVERRQRRVAHPRAPAGPPVLTVEDTDGELLGVSETESVGSVTLTPTHVVAHELQPDALAQYFARSLGLTGRVKPVSQDFEGVYLLGERQLRSGGLTFYLASMPLDHSQYRVLAHELKAPMRPPRFVLLSPEDMTSEAIADRTYGLPFPWRRLDHLFSDIVERLGLQAEVEAVDRVPGNVRLVVDRREQRAWLDRVELELSDGHEFELMTALAAHAATGSVKPVTEGELQTKIRSSDGSRVRTVFGKLMAKVSAGMGAAGHDIDLARLKTLFKAKQGYRFNGLAKVF